MRLISFIFVIGLIHTLILPAKAVTLRYALIIGNNFGVDENGKQLLPPLMHAEREARLLKERLVGISNFDKSEKRTRLLTAATIDDVKKAFAELASQRQEDEALLDNFDSIFLLYFTGHGLSGKLLLRDGPLFDDTLTELFNSVGADFSVGVFDACYAGSLYSELKEKGIRPEQAFNIGQTLPSEVLSAKGSVWLVSSGSDQPSYEDDHLGGVFTHFFIEALVKAEPDGPGITLERIWQYAQKKTTRYAAQRSRRQVPEQLVYKMRAQGPVYFSFPRPRSATLVLSKELEGKFALSYASGHLTEVFTKKRGSQESIPVFAGDARLILLSGDATENPERTFTLGEGGTLVIQPLREPVTTPTVGERATSLLFKGKDTEVDKNISVTHLEPGVSVLAGASGGISLASEKVAHPRYLASIPVRIDWDRVFGVAAASFGYRSETYSAWGYRLYMAGGAIGAGYGFDVWRLRLCGKGLLGFAHIWQQYDSHRRKQGWSFQPKLEIGALFPRNRNYLIEVSLNMGSAYGPSISQALTNEWCFYGGAGLAIYYRII
jgi:hypothetical protein